MNGRGGVIWVDGRNGTASSDPSGNVVAALERSPSDDGEIPSDDWNLAQRATTAKPFARFITISRP